MKINIKKNIPLSKLTTFRVGGHAKYYAEVKDKKELMDAILFAKDKSLPVFVLGGGSDILLSDEGFKGLVIRYKGKKFSFSEKNGQVLATAGAGLNWDDLVRASVEKNLQGIECLSGIPGSVGAAPIQNIGAYGQELKDVFIELTAYDIKDNKFVNLDKKECEFSYRESIFKKPKNKGRYFITEIKLQMKKGAKPTITYKSLKDFIKEKSIKNPSLNQIRAAVLELRGQKLEDPKVLGNAGSFFKNPIVEKRAVDALLEKYPQMPFYPADGDKYKLFAGWLIDKAGWKGKRVKGAMVSKNNALVLTNPEGRATAKDVRKLSDDIKKDIKAKFGVVLEPEVQFIGF